MKRQHYRSDLTLNVKITRPANSDDGGGQVAIPEHVRLEYFVPDGRTSIVAERNGKDTTLCKLSEDGMSLEVFLPLSRRQLGVGNLIVVITEYSPAAGFPDEIKEIHNPSETGIQLWRGASDGDGTITTEAELVAWRYGYSAYELAKIHGFEGTEEEFITWLRQPAVDASSKADSAELERAKAETRRVSAERGRVSAEEGRREAEKERANAESSRAIAENSRVKAEQERVDEFNRLKLGSQQATQAANDAASKANTQAAAAEKAASMKVVIDVETGIVSILKGEEKEDIGRIPEARGEYVEGQTYYKDNIATRYGSAFQCVAESTTTPPATLDESGNELVLGEGWIYFADTSIARSVAHSADKTSAEVSALLDGLDDDQDFSELPLLCGQPIKLFGHGAPSASSSPDNWRQLADGGYDWNGIPSALGQEYIDVDSSTGGHYIAVRDSAWKLKWYNC